MLEINNVHKSFGKNQILKGVDLNVEKGDIIVILGPSGSGKTTLLRCINFLERAEEGTINFDYSYYAFISSNIMPSMQALFDQCKQMMDVTDEEIEAYRKEREKIEKSSSQDEDAREKKFNEVRRLVHQLDSLQKKQD